MPPTTNKNWFERNWKWLASFGCLTTIIIIIGFIAAMWFSVTGIMKSFSPYQQAVKIAKSNDKVVGLLGTPIKESSFYTGTVNQVNDTGDANIAIPLSGPKGKTTLFLKAQKKAEKWIILELTFENEKTKERIQLPTTEQIIKY